MPRLPEEVDQHEGRSRTASDALWVTSYPACKLGAHRTWLRHRLWFESTLVTPLATHQDRAVPLHSKKGGGEQAERVIPYKSFNAASMKMVDQSLSVCGTSVLLQIVSPAGTGTEEFVRAWQPEKADPLLS